MNLHDTPTTEPKLVLDEEDMGELFDDCRVFLETLLERSQPQWVTSEALALLKRLNEVTGEAWLH